MFVDFFPCEKCGRPYPGFRYSTEEQKQAGYDWYRRLKDEHDRLFCPGREAANG